MEVIYAVLMGRRYKTMYASLEALNKLSTDEQTNLSPWMKKYGCVGRTDVLALLGLFEGAVISAYEENRSDVAVTNSNSVAMAGIRLSKLQVLLAKQNMRNYDMSYYKSLQEGRKLTLKDELSLATKSLGMWALSEAFLGRIDQLQSDLVEFFPACSMLDKIDPAGYHVRMRHDLSETLNQRRFKDIMFTALLKAMIEGFGDFEYGISVLDDLGFISGLVQQVRGKPSPGRAGRSTNFYIAQIMQLGHELILRKEGAPNTYWRVEQLEYLLRDHLR